MVYAFVLLIDVPASEAAGERGDSVFASQESKADLARCKRSIFVPLFSLFELLHRSWAKDIKVRTALSSFVSPTTHRRHFGFYYLSGRAKKYIVALKSLLFLSLCLMFGTKQLALVAGRSLDLLFCAGAIGGWETIPALGTFEVANGWFSWCLLMLAV